MILNANDFIQAIKTVRTLGSPQFTVRPDDKGNLVVVPANGPIGLKDAKDFIEDVMALGVRRYLDQQVLEQARERDRRFRYRNPLGVQATDGGSNYGDPDDDIRF